MGNARFSRVRPAHRRRCTLTARDPARFREPAGDRIRGHPLIRHQTTLVARGDITTNRRPLHPGRGAGANRTIKDPRRMAISKQTVIASLIGIAIVIGLANWSGVDSVGHAVASVGWGIMAVVMVRAVTVSVAGAGWGLLFPRPVCPEIQTCVFFRFFREACPG